ncbi:NSE3 protein, partial [Acromyrmex charruanus]
MSVYEPNSRHLREVLIFCFNMKKSAAEAHRMLSNTYCEAAISERTCREWFQRFKNGDVFGYSLVEVEGNKYILVNKIENDLPHLTFNDNHKLVLLYLVLVHIFMYGESCKEEILWDFLQNLGIITDDNFQHEYFGDIKQLVTIDFVNQRYLEKVIINKNDPTDFEFTWGSRAKNELTYRSALQFVADVSTKICNIFNSKEMIMK